MRNDRPQDIHEYEQWLEKKHQIKITDNIRNHYESVVNSIKSGLEVSNIWTQLCKNLHEYNDEYLMKTKYPLLLNESGVVVCKKPFDSFLLKTFRKNILNNSRWPEAPESGWIFPNNWFIKINDVVRTLIIVKYLDGLEFLIDKIRFLCKQCGAPCDVSLEAKEEGYYAAHVYLKQEYEVPKINWDTEKITALFEIQISTQLQDSIQKLLHKYYEDRRKKGPEEKIIWQWNYRSDEFVANYLGHILHYVEGMIMEIRERQKEK
jgi:hypothetical protein